MALLSAAGALVASTDPTRIAPALAVTLPACALVLLYVLLRARRAAARRPRAGGS